MLKSEEENDKDKNKSSLWDMSKKSFVSPFSKSKKSIPASNNSNKRFLLLELFNKKIKEDMTKEWKNVLTDGLKKYSEIISDRCSGSANFIVHSSQDLGGLRSLLGSHDEGENDENNENI